ncbi:MAG TPA: nucleotide-binding protein [Pirellulales bacterium]
MTDLLAFSMQLYDVKIREREANFAKVVETSINVAASRRRLGMGYFHKELTDLYARELRERAGCFLDCLLETHENLSPSVATDLTKQCLDHIASLDREFENLAEKRLQSFNSGFPWQPSINGAANDARADLRARIALAAFRQQRAKLPASDSNGSEAMPAQRIDDEKKGRVFVVHGRDTTLRDSMFKLLRSLGLEPIDWDTAVTQSGKAAPFVGEVLDSAFTYAQAAVVLISPDDEVRLHHTLCAPSDAEDETEIRMQPRPNVMFEAGMAFGRLPDNTLIVECGRSKQFSDITGRHTLRLDGSLERRENLVKRLRTAGCALKIEGEDWKTVGGFGVSRAPTGWPVAKDREGQPKYVDLDYPRDAGYEADVAQERRQLAWVRESEVARKVDLEGWDIIWNRDNDGSLRRLKLKDPEGDLTLLSHERADLDDASR